MDRMHRSAPSAQEKTKGDTEDDGCSFFQGKCLYWVQVPCHFRRLRNIVVSVTTVCPFVFHVMEQKNWPELNSTQIDVP